MTGLTAKTFGLAGRGVLKEGFAADIAHLRWQAKSMKRRLSPSRSSRRKGIDTVIVNGEVVWRGGKPTGARPGMVLSRR